MCKERYPGMKTKQINGRCTCYRCALEKNGNCFSKWNNMDPDK